MYPFSFILFFSFRFTVFFHSSTPLHYCHYITFFLRLVMVFFFCFEPLDDIIIISIVDNFSFCFFFFYRILENWLMNYTKNNVSCCGNYLIETCSDIYHRPSVLILHFFFKFNLIDLTNQTTNMENQNSIQVANLSSGKYSFCIFLFD